MGDLVGIWLRADPPVRQQELGRDARMTNEGLMTTEDALEAIIDSLDESLECLRGMRRAVRFDSRIPATDDVVLTVISGISQDYRPVDAVITKLEARRRLAITMLRLVRGDGPCAEGPEGME